MTKWMIAFACALALALAFAVPSSDQAAARGRGKNKQCIGTSMLGQKSTWRCKASERCCYNAVLNVGTCSTSASCL